MFEETPFGFAPSLLPTADLESPALAAGPIFLVYSHDEDTDKPKISLFTLTNETFKAGQVGRQVCFGVRERESGRVRGKGEEQGVSEGGRGGGRERVCVCVWVCGGGA